MRCLRRVRLSRRGAHAQAPDKSKQASAVSKRYATRTAISPPSDPPWRRQSTKRDSHAYIRKVSDLVHTMGDAPDRIRPNGSSIHLLVEPEVRPVRENLPGRLDNVPSFDGATVATAWSVFPYSDYPRQYSIREGGCRNSTTFLACYGSRPRVWPCRGRLVHVRTDRAVAAAVLLDDRRFQGFPASSRRLGSHFL